MKKMLFVLAVLIFFAGYGLCEELKMDGWGKVKWGMTEDAVKQAEPNVEIGDGKADKDDYYFPFILKNVKIANKDFNAKFRFNKTSKKLEAVTLIPIGDGDSYLFDKVFELLLTKYGKPIKTENDRKFGSREALWTVDKTKISLRHASAGKINLFGLSYEARSEGNDNL